MKALNFSVNINSPMKKNEKILCPHTDRKKCAVFEKKRKENQETPNPTYHVNCFQFLTAFCFVSRERTVQMKWFH